VPSHDPACTLTARDYKGALPEADLSTVVSFHPTQDPITSTGACHSLSANANATAAVAVSLRGRDGGGTAEIGGQVQNALRASQGGGDKPHIMQGMSVRRLTPRECERLQGFPDDYTRIPWKGGYWSADNHAEDVRAAIAEKCPDGPRYKALGNSMAVPVMRWIGERIQMVEDLPADYAEDQVVEIIAGMAAGEAL
jgi:DNA (cytosine-5)-methyltransferase 1